MRPALRPVLQLIRLPNVFTAAADGLAGWLIVGGRLEDPDRWLPVAMASMAFYAAGMALNDWFDLEVDRAERPGRPLPSGAVPVRWAAAIGWGGLALGLALAAFAGGGFASSPFAVGVALAAAITGYNAGLKNTPLGPWAMGSCRALNLLLGAAAGAASDLGGPMVWLAAAAFGAFVAGVTWISRSEAHGGETRNVKIGLAIQVAAILAFGAAAVGLAASSKTTTDQPARLIGLIVLAEVLRRAVGAGLRAVRSPSPAMIQQAVKSGVLSLVWLDVALVATARGPLPALAVAALWPPAFLLARRLYAT